MTRLLMLATLLTAAPAAAQTNPLTLGNLKGDVARVSGKPPAKSITQMVADLKGAPTYVAPPPPPPRDPYDEACTLNVADAYALSDATQAIVQATVTNQYGEPCTRSFSLYAAPSNGPGFGYGYWDYPANRLATVFPSHGSKIEWAVPIRQPQRGRVGRFPFNIQSTEGLGFRQVQINIVDAYPAGVKAPVSFGPMSPATLKLPTRAPDLAGDFLGADWKDWEQVSFNVNGQVGLSVIAGTTKTKSGFAPDPYRIETMDGRPTRVFRPVDVRTDPIATREGDRPWAVGGIARKMPDVSGVFSVTVDFGPGASTRTPNDQISMNNAWWHWIASRPVEQDNHEHNSGTTDTNGMNRFPMTTYHENAGNQLEAVRLRKIAFAPFGDKLGWHTIVRVRSVEKNVTDYYVDGVRVIEAQNLGMLNHWAEQFFQEGPGGVVAGPYDKLYDYSRAYMALRDWKWWTLKATDAVRPANDSVIIEAAPAGVVAALDQD